ncbi:MAG: hypothetical protein JXR41_07000, partial [Bacteroidales bacterium]|nr:hypothetical protein [Bacteroidales bacterium]
MDFIYKIAKAIVGMLPAPLRNPLRRYRRKAMIAKWERSGKPIPPPHQVKQSVIEYYRKRSGYDILIETGTYRGDMVYAQRNNFKRIFSIELGEDLWKKAVKRFARYRHICIMQGDSSKVLDNITKDLQEPAIFWLDGHYSAGITARGDKDCPIYGEINAIFRYKKLDHILLVDDACYFNGTGD